MQTTYATHLELPHREDGRELDSAVGALTRWVRRRFGVRLDPIVGGNAEGHDTSVNWSLLSDPERGLFGVWVDQPDRVHRGWRWRNYADVGIENRSAWFRVRVNLYSTRVGVLQLPNVEAGRPGVVRELVDELGIHMDGRPLGDVVEVEASDIEAFVDLVTGQGRQLPVIAISCDERGDYFIDPVRAADRLLGLAHVAALDTEASWALTTKVTKRWSCYGGAVRIYWPSFSRQDNVYRHRLYLGGALDFLGSDGLDRELFDLLGRVAGLSIDEPPLRRELVLQRRAAEVERRAEERAAATARVTSAADSNEYVSADEFAQFAHEFESMEKNLAVVEADALEQEREVERLRAERDDARRQVVELSAAFAKPDGEFAEDEATPPSSVIEAVERAKSEAHNTVYLESAFDSARASGYSDPSRVLDDLRLVDEVARDWSAGELATGPSDAFAQRSSAFRRGISQTAATTYRDDYAVEWQGETVLLGPHIRRGIGAVSSILRIYMYFDTDRQIVVVGHVGRKLRDDSNRN